jgi:hypothetical protein
LPRRVRLWLERLEDRLSPAVIDLTSPGASGVVGGAIFEQFTQSAAGSGNLDSFVRLSTNAAVEQGYNTDFRPVQFNETSSSSFTRALPLASVPTVVASGGLAYYEFVLDINQLSSPPGNLLSLDDLRLYVTNSSTTDPNLLHAYNPSTHTLQDDAGRAYAPAYDLNPSNDGNYIELNGNLSHGSGKGDMIALIPVSSLSASGSPYVYLYSHFGVHMANTGGYEQWAAGTGPAEAVGSIMGQAFLDQNANGVRDTGEPGLAGVAVYLDANNNGVLDPGEVATVTAADGSFSFGNLLPGTYHVRQVVPGNYAQTARLNADLTLGAGQAVSGVLFGDALLGSISGTQYEDVTGNGFSPEDPVLNAANPDYVPVTVQLFQGSGSTPLATTTTDSAGHYTFPGLAPGTYTVREVVPNGWFQTAAPPGTITIGSGTASAGNNFDDFLVARLDNNGARLTAHAMPAVPGTLTITQGPGSVTNVFLGAVQVGTFNTPALQSVQVTSAAGYTVNTSQVTSAPVVLYDTPGDNVYLGGSSGTTLLLNSGGHDMVSVTGGVNALNFSPTSFGVTFDAGLTQGQTQTLDSSGRNLLTVTGTFQTVVGTAFADTLTAALPTFNAITGAVGPGTAILSGLGQDRIYGSLGTTAETDGSGSAYTQVLSAGAVSELEAAIARLGASPGNLAAFGSMVIATGGSSAVSTSLLTAVNLAGTQNSYAQAFDPNSAQALQMALASFGGSARSLGGFGGSVSAAGGFNLLQTSALTNATLTGGTNTYIQALDPSVASVLESTVTSFGNSTGTLGGFGNSLRSLGGFGGSVTAAGGFNAIYTSLLTNVSSIAGTNTYVQSIDPNAAQVLEGAIRTVQQRFGGSAASLGGFGNVLNTLGGFGNSLNSSGGFNAIYTSILTAAAVAGGNTVYVQAIDPNAAGVLDSAIQAFGNSLTSPGGFGNSLASSGGFGNTLTTAGGYNIILTSLLTSVTSAAGNNQYAQSLDPNAAGVLQTAIGAFGNSTASLGGFGNVLNTLGGFGNSLTAAGGFNTVYTSILTTATLGGGNNTYVQSLDADSAQVLDQAISAFGASLGSSGGFGGSLNSSGGFGNSLIAAGGFTTVYTSLLTAVTITGGYNLYYQALDANSIQVLATALSAVTAFGGSVSNLGGFGNSLRASGGYNGAQAGLLTAVQLSGGFDTFVEQLAQDQVDFAGDILSAAGTGAGAADAAAAAIGLQAALGDGNDVAVGGLLATVQAGTGSDRLVIEDPTLLGAASVGPSLLAYGGKFAAGAGSNTFYFAGSLFGHVAVSEPAANHDTLDLSSVQAASPTLDLGTAGEQQVLPGRLWLTLSDPAGFSSVVGNGNGTTVKAGAGNVLLEGAAPLDDRAANPPAPQGPVQVVYLDFVDFNPPGDHVYTSDEQAAILQRLQQVYQPFSFSFTLQPPVSGPYTTIFFNEQPPGGEPGGYSSEIDWRNLNPSDTAVVDVNGLLGGAGQPPATTGPNGNFVALSADIAAHELGHTVGLRHQDAFGPVDFGVHNPPGVTAFRPAYPGAAAAWETTQHIMASPAAVGSTLFDAVGNTYFGERELIKLAFIQDGTVVNEQTNPDGSNANVSLAAAQPLTLTALAVPNTQPRGFDAGKVFSVAAVDVANASLRLDPATGLTQSDYYSFSGRAGDLVHLETMSNSLARITDPVDTVLNLYDSAGHLLATSDDDFETADSLITDFTLPGDGTYFVEVKSFSNTATGHYELFLYRSQAGNAIPAGGSDDTFVAGPGNDTFIGRGGNDTVQDSGAAVYTLADGSLTGTGTATLQNVHNAVLTGGANGTVFNVSGWTGSATLIGVGGTNTVVVNRDTNFTLTADTLTLANGGTFYLINIQNVLLTGGPSGSTFDVGGWAGLATLTGVGGTNTVVASHGGNFVLTDSSLALSGGGSFTLVNVHNAVLTGGASGSTFDLRGWTGTATLNSLGGANPVLTPRGNRVTTQEGFGTPVVAGFTDAGLTVATTYAGTVDWGDGSSSAAAFGVSGAAVSVTGTHFYHEEGTYTLTTTFSQGTAFSVIVSSAAAVADAPLANVQVPTINATEGIPTGTIVEASFTDPGGSEPLGDYAATIQWGDGGSTAGTIVDLGNGRFNVTAGHVYLEEGTYTVTVSVTHDRLPSVVATGTARVADAALTATATPFVPLQGIALNNTRVATFVDANPAGKPGDFTVTINWGDGTSSPGTVSQPNGIGSAFAVAGTHTYSAPGAASVVVTIADVGGQTASASFVVSVGPSIFVLDPTAGGALTVTGTVTLNVNGAVVVDSNSATALSASGNSAITASQILVTGGVSVSNGAVLSPAPTTGVPRLPDPLASLAVPSGNLPFRGSVNLTRGSLTIQPGVYTQIQVSGKGTVLTLSPGIYVLKGGGLSVSNSASINGSGVVVYNAGSNFPNPGGTFGAISLSGSGTFGLAAPTSGTYAGVLFFQARDNTQAISLTANAAVGLAGTLYAPAAQLVINGGGQLRTAAIVDQLRFTGNGGGPAVFSGLPRALRSGAGAVRGKPPSASPRQLADTAASTGRAGKGNPVLPPDAGAATPGVGTRGASAETPSAPGGPPEEYLAAPPSGAADDTGVGPADGDRRRDLPAAAPGAARRRAVRLQVLDVVFADLGGRSDEDPTA